MDKLRGIPAPYLEIEASFDPRVSFQLMARARALEERLIKMSLSSDGHFWIGAPGEEAFSVPLGQQVKRGEGPGFDYLHLHYRGSPTMLAMGMEMIEATRQMGSRATDPFSGGRNFANHYARRAWNVLPVTSTIETQYVVAIGTAEAQRRHGGDGITIVTGGDAGTAEGDFASALVWANRPGRALPLLIVVTNNRYGISTPYDEVHGDAIIAQRAAAFGIRWEQIDGNDLWVSQKALAGAMAYVRKERKPFVLEARVSRLHGHSSSSGAARVDEFDCLKATETRLITEGLLTEADAQAIHLDAAAEAKAARDQAMSEPVPHASTIYDHTFA